MFVLMVSPFDGASGLIGLAGRRLLKFTCLEPHTPRASHASSLTCFSIFTCSIGQAITLRYSIEGADAPELCDRNTPGLFRNCLIKHVQEVRTVKGSRHVNGFALFSGTFAS